MLTDNNPYCSVATVDHPAHELVLPQHSRDTRRHSAAPFSLATGLPARADSKYQTSDIPRHSKALSSHDNHFIAVEDPGHEKALLLRMGRKLSTFLPIGVPTEAQSLPVLQINMKKEVHISMEESARDAGSSGNDSPLLRKPPPLRKKPSDEIYHRFPGTHAYAKYYISLIYYSQHMTWASLWHQPHCPGVQETDGREGNPSPYLSQTPPIVRR